MSEKFVKIDDLKEYHKLVAAVKRGQEDHVVVRYGGPCMEHAENGGIHVFYGAPCNHLDQVDFKGKDYIGLKYGGPCKPPYIIVKYGGPCKDLRS
jgi:hypothetical protein